MPGRTVASRCGARRRPGARRAGLGTRHRRCNAPDGHRRRPLQFHVQPRARQRRHIVERLVGFAPSRAFALVERSDGTRVRDAHTGGGIQLLPQGDRCAGAVGLLHGGGFHDPDRPRVGHRVRAESPLRKRRSVIRISARDLRRVRRDVEHRRREPSLGLGLSPDGAITETPTSAALAQFTVSARNGSKATSKQLTLRVTEPITVTAPTAPAIKLGRQFLVTFAAKGGLAPYKWSGVGLPEGIGVDPASGRVGRPEVGRQRADHRRGD